MGTIEHSTILKAPPERVFALLERVEDFTDYSDLVHAVEPLGDNRYRWHVHVVGRDWTFDVAITERRAPELLAWESLAGVENHGCYRLTPVEEGTKVALTLTYTIHNRLLEKAVNKAARPLVGRVSRQILERVEARL
ncbi:SRPBCC family protein [Halomonas cerina]|uniref:Putative membrane protein n=1 Tax=Halomonas cerina TaxID=447424 RepID=A0A839V8F4_9GAMM|nr:SRPBCC family protein [Halomonas cerina]MBB3189007.1 putative membrane protein [Halomonas cerina]